MRGYQPRSRGPIVRSTRSRAPDASASTSRRRPAQRQARAREAALRPPQRGRGRRGQARPHLEVYQAPDRAHRGVRRDRGGLHIPERLNRHDNADGPVLFSRDGPDRRARTRHDCRTDEERAVCRTRGHGGGRPKAPADAVSKAKRMHESGKFSISESRRRPVSARARCTEALHTKPTSRRPA